MNVFQTTTEHYLILSLPAQMDLGIIEIKRVFYTPQISCFLLVFFFADDLIQYEIFLNEHISHPDGTVSNTITPSPSGLENN